MLVAVASLALSALLVSALVREEIRVRQRTEERRALAEAVGYHRYMTCSAEHCEREARHERVMAELPPSDDTVWAAILAQLAPADAPEKEDDHD